MLLIIMLYPVLVMGFKDLLAGLLGFMSWQKKKKYEPLPALLAAACTSTACTPDALPA
jgi:hypothetical protein